jgi:type VI secretion system protein ImpJ
LSWGIGALTIDEPALENGLFHVKSCEVILPSGKLLTYDGVGVKTLSYPLTQHASVHELYLCIPIKESVSGVTGYYDNKQTPSGYVDFIEVADDYDRDRVREVMVLKDALFLFSEHDPRDQYHSIKIAELNHLGEHNYTLDEKFIPTVLHTSASRVLQHSIRRIVEFCEAKINFLKERRRSLNNEMMDFSQSDLAHFLLLETLLAEFPELKHIALQSHSHPEKVYLSLARLAGKLTVFQEEGDEVLEIPAYTHQDLTSTFSAMELTLLKLINIVLPTRTPSIKLNRENNMLYVAENIDKTILSEQSFFIAVYFVSEDPSWIQRFSQHVKVSSRSRIDIVLSSALTGAHITHQQRTPSRLPIKAGYEYFRINTHGKDWESISGEQSLALFVSQEFEQAKVDIVTVKE